VDPTTKSSFATVCGWKAGLTREQVRLSRTKLTHVIDSVMQPAARAVVLLLARNVGKPPDSLRVRAEEIPFSPRLDQFAMPGFSSHEHGALAKPARLATFRL
jgi:hypothetical protein